MRQRKKEELLEMIETLQSAMTELQMLIRERKSEAVLELLADCQNAAIVVGNTIEELEKKETEAVHLLEEWCELIYACANADEEQVQLKYCESMEQKLVQIQDEIRT